MFLYNLTVKKDQTFLLLVQFQVIKTKRFFPVLSPDPATNKDVNFLNYPVYVGGNRGRGQVYPTGEKSNNNAYTSTAAGQITAIEPGEKGKVNPYACNS